jgi:hypothetical protein
MEFWFSSRRGAGSARDASRLTRPSGSSDLETVEETLGGCGDLDDCLVEHLLVVGRRLGEPGDLADELTGGGFDLLVGSWVGSFAEHLD